MATGDEERKRPEAWRRQGKCLLGRQELIDKELKEEGEPGPGRGRVKSSGQVDRVGDI